MRTRTGQRTQPAGFTASLAGAPHGGPTPPLSRRYAMGGGRRKKRALVACGALSLLIPSVAGKPLSDPIVKDSPDTTGNKFLARSAFRDELGGACVPH